MERFAVPRQAVDLVNWGGSEDLGMFPLRFDLKAVFGDRNHNLLGFFVFGQFELGNLP